MNDLREAIEKLLNDYQREKNSRTKTSSGNYFRNFSAISNEIDSKYRDDLLIVLEHYLGFRNTDLLHSLLAQDYDL